MFRLPLSVAIRHCTAVASEQATVYVSSLPWTSGKGQLIDHFRQFGPVANVYLPYNEKSGLSKGYALVRFRRSYDAEKAVQGAHEIDGRQVLNLRDVKNSLNALKWWSGAMSKF